MLTWDQTGEILTGGDVLDTCNRFTDEKPLDYDGLDYYCSEFD